MAGNDTQPAMQPHALEDASTWLLVMFVLLFLVPLVLGLSA